ncbi:MAG: Dam family site-specific DNA-(adenine-N6)-methyltransferase [Anaerolineae bacterium]|nr:Dam family site-specific DNA-(adenine-N6)-methyltransferase [Anaerolineae bacterium]
MTGCDRCAAEAQRAADRPGLGVLRAAGRHLNPPLKWAGGKRWLVPTLRDLWRDHAHRPLVEPFAGGMAVALGLRPGEALLNDVNRHLIHFYRWLQRGLVTGIETCNDKALYYRHRRRFNELIDEGRDDTQEAAELFYYLNRTGYNGLCRFNRKGRFNVPFGRYRTIHYTRDFSHYAPVLSAWQFASRDFEDLQLDPEAFVYADPPYDVEFTSYSAGGFGWEDQVRLAEWLARHPGPVVASNQATERVVRLYRGLGFEIRLLDAPRRISCKGDRSPAREMLALRWQE